jgi:beta-1,4-mannosyltransferase
VQTLWLAIEDYPLLLGAADLGLCLHRSSSGLDLPMKIADMFGSGLPVCALDYGPCLTELVRHGEDGLVFSTSEQLANQLYELFQGFPNATPLLARLRRNASECGRVRWLEGWQKDALPVFERLTA